MARRLAAARRKVNPFKRCDHSGVDGETERLCHHGLNRRVIGEVRGRAMRHIPSSSDSRLGASECSLDLRIVRRSGAAVHRRDVKRNSRNNRAPSGSEIEILPRCSAADASPIDRHSPKRRSSSKRSRVVFVFTSPLRGLSISTWPQLICRVE